MNFICPKDGGRLTLETAGLKCAHGHEFRVVNDVPILLRDDVTHTLGVAAQSLRATDSPLYLSSVGVSERERELARTLLHGAIDPVASVLVGATSGYAYKRLVGRLVEYPIPDIPIPNGRGSLLDVGCSWGRWSIAASRKGYAPVGIDPSLGAVLAAKRAANHLGADARFVCADGRFLPFESGSFDLVHSYSVLQHLGADDLRLVVAEIARVLRPGGTALIQMAHRIGARSLYHQLRARGEPTGFEVRYRGMAELHEVFSTIGPTRITAHCFGGLGLEPSDVSLYSPATRSIVAISWGLVAASRVLKPLVGLADSVYVRASKPFGPRV